MIELIRFNLFSISILTWYIILWLFLLKIRYRLFSHLSDKTSSKSLYMNIIIPWHFISDIKILFMFDILFKIKNRFLEKTLTLLFAIFWSSSKYNRFYLFDFLKLIIIRILCDLICSFLIGVLINCTKVIVCYFYIELEITNHLHSTVLYHWLMLYLLCLLHFFIIFTSTNFCDFKYIPNKTCYHYTHLYDTHNHCDLFHNLTTIILWI